MRNARKKNTPKELQDFGVFYAVVDDRRIPLRRMPCLAGRQRDDAKGIREPFERIVKVRVVEVS